MASEEEHAAKLETASTLDTTSREFIRWLLDKVDNLPFEEPYEESVPTLDVLIFHDRVEVDMNCIPGGRFRTAAIPIRSGKLSETVTNIVRNLRANCLLFMEKIEEISIKIYDVAEAIQKRETFSIRRPENISGFTIIRKEAFNNIRGTSMRHVRHFWVQKSDEVDGRVAVALKVARAGIIVEDSWDTETEEFEEAEVVDDSLVPLEEDDTVVPIPYPSNYYAGHPVTVSPMMFMINADFDFQDDDRRRIAKTDRNKILIEKAASIFVEAVKSFGKHPSLRYTWMRYLPHGFNELRGLPKAAWEHLKKKIGYYLLFPRLIEGTKQSIRLYSILAVRRLPDGELMTRYAQCIAKEDGPIVFVSRRYQGADLDLLREYGLHHITLSDRLDAIYHDTKQWQLDPRPPIQMIHYTRIPREGRAEENWISSIFDYSVPLATYSAFNGELYLPQILDDGIPGLQHLDDIVDLNIVHPLALHNPNRAKYFDNMQLKSPPVDLVHDAITSLCQQPDIKLADSIEYLHFLYLTSHRSSNTLALRRCPSFHMFDYENVLMDAQARPDSDNEAETAGEHSNKLYISSHAPFQAYELLKRAWQDSQTKHNPVPESLQDVFFLHPAYFEDEPDTPEGQDLCFSSWLSACLSRVDDFNITLTTLTPTGDELSDICQYIARYRPEKLTGFLNQHWHIDGDILEANDGKLWDELKTTFAWECEDGAVRPLVHTYVPTQELVVLVNSFMEADEFFPWLVTDDLPEIGVRADSLYEAEEASENPESLTLYPQTPLNVLIDVLRNIRLANPHADELTNPERLVELYAEMQKFIFGVSKESREVAISKIRKAFRGQDWIYVPETEADEACWAQSDDRFLVWNLGSTSHPEFVSLKDTYYQMFEAAEDRKSRGRAEAEEVARLAAAEHEATKKTAEESTSRPETPTKGPGAEERITLSPKNTTKAVPSSPTKRQKLMVTETTAMAAPEKMVAVVITKKPTQQNRPVKSVRFVEGTATPVGTVTFIEDTTRRACPNLRVFFLSVFSIGNITEKHVIDKIIQLKNSGTANVEAATALYKELNSFTSKSSRIHIKELFKEKLIFVPETTEHHASWEIASRCSWLPSIRVSQKRPLAEAYPELEKFFVNLLDIERGGQRAKKLSQKPALVGAEVVETAAGKIVELTSEGLVEAIESASESVPDAAEEPETARTEFVSNGVKSADDNTPPALGETVKTAVKGKIVADSAVNNSKRRSRPDTASSSRATDRNAIPDIDINHPIDSTQGASQPIGTPAFIAAHSVLPELGQLWKDKQVTLATMTAFYEKVAALSKEFTTEEQHRIRRGFKDYRCICVFEKITLYWKKSSKCVWKCAEHERANPEVIPLDNLYPSLKTFFVDVVRVKEHTDAAAISIIEDTMRTLYECKRKDLYKAFRRAESLWRPHDKQFRSTLVKIAARTISKERKEARESMAGSGGGRFFSEDDIIADSQALREGREFEEEEEEDEEEIELENVRSSPPGVVQVEASQEEVGIEDVEMHDVVEWSREDSIKL